MTSIIIQTTQTLLEALQYLETNKKRFLICINEEKKTVGTLNDGDIRRALLKNKTLQTSIYEIMNKEFMYLTLQSNFDEVCEKFKSQKIDFLPIVDEKMYFVNYISKKQFHAMLLENIKFSIQHDFSKFDATSLEHEIYNRPWGFYKSTMLTPLAQAKIITIFPNEELSLQKHEHREEHWVFIKGEGKIILEQSVMPIHPGKYVFIPKGCKHKIINDSNENIIFSEIQLGEYFGEDDIIRYEDKYGRVKQ